jgi:indole-3-glycerol phosphate synthase
MTTRRGLIDTGSILDQIVAAEAEHLEATKRNMPLETLRDTVSFSNGHGLGRMVTSPKTSEDAPSGEMRIIAEIKKASPSRGILAHDLDHRRIAREYALAGAVGISVVTEPNYFLGDIEWLRDVREMLAEEFPGSRPSLLRKDFIFDPYQILQARAYGADNILLIVAMLGDSLLRDFLEEAEGLELEALVEVHTEAEAERAVKAGATLFGINNRDLHTFAVDLATTERIRPLLPPDAVVIGESGVQTRADVERLFKAGVQAILVGEAFMTAPDIAAKIAELRL